MSRSSVDKLKRNRLNAVINPPKQGTLLCANGAERLTAGSCWAVTRILRVTGAAWLSTNKGMACTPYAATSLATTIVAEFISSASSSPRIRGANCSAIYPCISHGQFLHPQRHDRECPLCPTDPIGTKQAWQSMSIRPRVTLGRMTEKVASLFARGSAPPLHLHSGPKRVEFDFPETTRKCAFHS